MKKILIFSNSLSSLYIFRSNLINDLSKNQENEILLLSNKEEILDKNLKKRIQKKNNLSFNFIDLHRTNIKFLNEAKTFFSILMFIFKKKPTHVFSFTIKPVIYTGIINFFFQFKHFPTITGLGRVFYPIWKRTTLKILIVFLYKISLRKVNKIFFQNQDDLNYFLDMKLVKKNKTQIINGSGVDTKFFKFDAHGFQKKNFLMIGRLLNQKGIKFFLEAAKIVKFQYPNYTFTLIGKKEEGPDSINLSEIQEFIDNKIIKYVAETDDVKKYIKESKVFVLPSYYREGMPKTMIEAMSIGRPVIVSNIPGPKDIIENYKHGILLDLSDSKSLINAIKYFIKINKQKYNDLSIKCRDTSVKIFDIKIINSIYKSYL